MHDPSTVAHQIKYPWYEHKPWPKKYRRDPNPWRLKRGWDEMPDELKAERSNSWPEGYRNDFITIWHVDPEHGGSDDSCGYSYVKITPKQREILRNAAWWEGHDVHFLRHATKEYPASAEEAECYYRGMVLLVARVLRLKVSMEYVARYAAEAVHIRTGGKFGGAFCFLPGYHTNSQKDSKEDRADHFHGILCNVASVMLTDRRPWYRHPKWHLWHWKFQIHFLESLKRRLFTRCCKCGKGFPFGASVCTNSWNGTGPRWFRSEEHVYHDDCMNPANACVAQEAEPRTA